MKLSVVTVNLNNVEGLRRTIGSIEEQTFQDFQYIVIDGNSTDGSQGCIKESSRVEFSISEDDSGVYDAMNKGIHYANGEYLLFLNSGDTLYAPDTLEKIVSHLDGVDLLYGNLYIMESSKSEIFDFPKVLTFGYLFHHFLGHPSTFLKRDLFEKFGSYDMRYAIVADWAFMVKVIAKENASTKHLDQVVSVFRADGMTADPKNYPQMIKEREQFLQESFPLFYADYINIEKERQGWIRIRNSKGYRILKALGLKKFK